MSSSVGIIFNPISGSGRAAKFAEHIRAVLEQNNFRPVLRESQRSYERQELSTFLEGLHALIVVGGDGTLMPLLEALAESRVAVSMFPAGNESLFARLFGMKADDADLLARLRLPDAEKHFYGIVNGKPFFSMVSVGLDADVVTLLSEMRCGPVGTKGYVKPLMTALRKFRVPTLTVKTKERTLIDRREGYLNIANCAEYARSLCLVPEAASTKPELHARFYPHQSKFFYFRWLLPLLLRRPLTGLSSELFAVSELEVEGSPPGIFAQADGEAIGSLPLKFSISKKPIRVLGKGRTSDPVKR